MIRRLLKLSRIGLMQANAFNNIKNHQMKKSTKSDICDNSFKMASISIFMVGDVMLARGIDMIQKHSCDPELYEGNRLDAYDYVHLAVSTNGPIPSKSDRGLSYTWGDAVGILEVKRPDVRIINLETSITMSKTPWPAKGIHYKMHPKNVEMIQSAGIDCCVLSNNHTADWGFEGLHETLSTLEKAKMSYAGAGRNISEARAPAVFNIEGKGRVLVFAGGHQSSGIPEKWRSTETSEGLNIVDIHNPDKAVQQVKDQVAKYKQAGDIVVFSVHWGGNWGYSIDKSHSKFAYAIIDEAGVDVVHGHSSHHTRAVEVYKGKLILYGCGDFINDYEGIGGNEDYRGDLALMYFAQIEPGTGFLSGLEMVPTHTKHLKVNKASEKDTMWMKERMSRECRKRGCDVELANNELHLVFNRVGEISSTDL